MLALQCAWGACREMAFKEKLGRVAPPIEDNLGPRMEDGSPASVDWAKYESAIFGKLLERTEVVFDQWNYTSAIEKVISDSSIPSARIACISPEFSVEDEDDGIGDFVMEDFRDGCKLAQATNRLNHKRWEDERLGELNRVLCETIKADVICFSELSYPPPMAVNDGGWTVKSIQNAVSRRLKFEEQVRTALYKHDSKAFVFLGSYHCLMTLYNIGVMYPWGASFGPVQVEVLVNRIGSEPRGYRTTVEPPIAYSKRFPARRAGEETRVPTGQQFDVFDRGFGRVGVMICSDVVDINQFLSVAQRNRSDTYEPIDFVLIPSFNNSSYLVRMCKNLSALAATTVIVVNANHTNEKYPDTQMFCCGIHEDELGNPRSGSKPIVTRSEETIAHGGGRKSTVIYFDLDLRAIDDMRDHFVQQRKKSGRGMGGSAQQGNV